MDSPNGVTLAAAVYLILFVAILPLGSAGKSDVEATPGEFLIGVEEISSRVIDLIEENVFEIIRIFGQIDVILVRVKDEVDAQKRLDTLASNPAIRYVEPNYIVKAEPIKAEQIVYIPQLGPTPNSQLNSPPNDTFWYTDPLYGIGQWNMRVIAADNAWDLHMGSHRVLVAVIDTGIRGTHLDLDANYMQGGYDWVNDDDNPEDDNGHGTHVAGIIAAETGNGFGVAGLAQASIIAEKVLDRRGVGTVANLVSGILHAADLGVDVMNLSLGLDAYSEALEEACRYAYDKGCLLVASAGNRNTDKPHYPAAFEEVIAVASTYGEPDDVRAPYSNYGEWITLSAPGGREGYPIISTYHLNDTSFAYMYGTSQAAPHVSSLAALYQSLHPSSTITDIEEALKEAVEDKGEPGWDKFYGYGRIDAYTTLTLPPLTPVGGEGEIISLNRQNPTTSSTSLAILASIFVTAYLLCRRLPKHNP